MRKIVSNLTTLVVAIIGAIGASLWILFQGWDYEPVIILFAAIAEITGFVFLTILTPDHDPNTKPITSSVNQNTTTINFGGLINEQTDASKSNLNKSKSEIRNALIETKKGVVKILFIDDDKEFKIVKILKDSGWTNTKSIVDLKSIDSKYVKDYHIFFVDINGVGKILDLEYEGLDLAYMIKSKYPDKKVVIYSASKKSNSFHQVWDIIDGRLEKNAIPYQFQNLVESFSLKVV